LCPGDVWDDQQREQRRAHDIRRDGKEKAASSVGHEFEHNPKLKTGKTLLDRVQII
jgi:hypothetical protein